MSDDDDDMVDELPSPLHLEAYSLIGDTCQQFVDLKGINCLPSKLDEMLNEVVENSKTAKFAKNHSVAVVGKTGCGKSTLLCALVQNMVLPTSSLVRPPDGVNNFGKYSCFFSCRGTVI